MILEGIVTTLNADGSTHISPMGPEVDRGVTRLRLRPFQSSTTYQNLKRTGEGVFHVVDDVELLAHAAVGQFDRLPSMRPARAISGQILADACRWYAFRVVDRQDESPRATLDCQIVDQQRMRDSWGFNRAKHAVLEAAILATRIDLLPAAEIDRQFAQLTPLVEKTAGDQERRAFEFLRQYVQNRTTKEPNPSVNP